MKGRKVLFVHDHIFYEFDGQFYTGASLNNDVLNKYKSFGDELVVISRTSKLSSMESRYSIASGHGIVFKPIKNIRTIAGILSLLPIYKHIKAEVDSADLIIIKLPSTTGILTWFAAMKKLNRVIVEVIGNSYEANMLHGSFLSKIVAPIEHYLTKYIVRNSANVIYITKKYLQSIYPNNNNVEICPNTYVDSVKVSNSESVSKIEKRIGLIGSLNVNYKGHETAIKVLRTLNTIDSGWTLHFIGGGNKTKWENIATELKVKECVHFEGVKKSGKEVFSFIDNMSFMLQPSKVEAQGRCIVESMSRQRVVVASNVGGIPELVGVNELFDVDDYNGIANRILELYNDKEDYLRIVKRQLEVIEEFDQSTIFKRRARFVKGVLNEGV